VRFKFTIFYGYQSFLLSCLSVNDAKWNMNAGGDCM
jgi:hypothetical protein